MFDDGIFSNSKSIIGISRTQSTHRIRKFYAREILHPTNLVAALLVTEMREVNKLPTICLSDLKNEIREIESLGIKAVKIFTKSSRKDNSASEALNEDNLSIKAIKEAREESDNICIITDTCLCSYTQNGDCIIREDNGTLDTEKSFSIINKHALLQSIAGADIIGPAPMCEGVIESIRAYLDNHQQRHISIMPHLTFRSSLYRGYRAAMETGSGSQREGFQIHPTSVEEYINMSIKMVNEGADVIMMQPSIFSFDIINKIKASINRQVGVYSVSGEYIMFNSLPYGNEIMFEHALNAKRAGADFIVTYGAKQIAQQLI